MSKTRWIKDNLKPGEEYAGIILGKNGEQDYHLILLPEEIERSGWDKAMAWVKAGIGQLPTLRELALLFANLREKFKSGWYWSSEQHAADSGSAWGQNFDYGGQGYTRKSYEGRARAVRRLPI